jgi:hypothetical protein
MIASKTGTSLGNVSRSVHVFACGPDTVAGVLVEIDGDRYALTYATASYNLQCTTHLDS